MHNKNNKVTPHTVEEVYLDNLFNTLIGDTSIAGGMTDEQKQQAMNFINKEEPSLLKKAGTELNKGVQKATDKVESTGLLKSKESSKTVSKKQNQMEKPKPTEAPQREEYVTKIDTPEKVEQVTQETAQEIVEAADDKSMWESALEGLGYAKELATDVWDDLGDSTDRVDWLTTLTVYAASRYMGNNGGLALANGLMRGMESKSKQKQLQAAMDAGQRDAKRKQANIERQFKIDEYNANTSRMNANTTLFNAQGKGKGFEQLTSEDQKVITALADSRDYDLAATQEAAAQLKASGQPLTAGNLDNKVKEMRDQGLLKNPWGGTAASFN